MNSRIQKLREQSLNAVNRISAERALLVTRFYKSREAEQVSIPVKRALTLSYILQNKSLCINPGELIVGERGPAPKATPTYPEITLHSLEDLEILDKRKKEFFRVDEETKKIYGDEIIPFWKGRTNRDRIMEALDPEWHMAYDAGIFTEFQEQRSPGHTVLGGKIYRKGMLDFIKEIQQAIIDLDFFGDPDATDKREELKAMIIAAKALIAYAERNAEELDLLSANESDLQRPD